MQRSSTRGAAGVAVGLAVAIVPLVLASLTPGAEALSPSSASASERRPVRTPFPSVSDAFATITRHAVAAVPASYEVAAAAVASPAAAIPAARSPAAAGPLQDQTDIYVLGDVDVVSDEVFNHLTSCATGSAVRLTGREPHEIAAELSRSQFDSADVVYLATIEEYDAALSVSAPNNEPVLLVGRDSLPTATTMELKRLAPRHIIVFGDDDTISSAVESALSAYARVVRLSGSEPPFSQVEGASGVPPIERKAVLFAAETAPTGPEVLRIAERLTGERVVVSDGHGLAETAALQVSSITGHPCDPLVPPPSCEAGWVALTFDDGPVPERSGAVLDALAQANIRATFFPVGFLTKSHPSILLKTANAGHVIANHTYEHENLVDLPDAAIAETLNRTTAAIRAAGVEPIALVRPPGGITDLRVKEALDRVGYRQILWTADPRDYDRRSASAIAHDVIANVRDGTVVLLHDNSNNYQNTAQATVTIVQVLEEKGYCFGVLDGTGTIVP